MKSGSIIFHAQKIGILLPVLLIILTTACQQTLPTASTTAGIPAASTSKKATIPKPENPRVRLSTTTSVSDSGLLPELEKIFESSTGYDLEVVANGTGAAIKLGESGDADVLLVHAKASEDVFVEAGYGIKRIPFMHNFFIIAGPANDKAKVSACADAVSAFKAIAGTQAAFVSRGDDSGTHKAELKIWETAKITPSGAWYVSAGKGMGPCLIMAGEMQAYILTDKATYLATREQTSLKILLGESSDLKNTYSLIAVNPAKNPGVNVKGAQAWIDFMLSEQARNYISAFGKTKYGEALFFHDGLGS